MFLTGYMSDMTGDKALCLDALCARRGQAFVRFDYQGHGASSGAFRDGTIGLWAEDALAVLDQLTEGPQILVGSSMGGWIMLLLARARPRRVAGLVGVAAAADFTEQLIWERYDENQRRTLMARGFIEEANDYDPAKPYIITRALIEDGRRHLLLDGPIPIAAPVRLIHGQKDLDVPWQTALAIKDRLVSADVEVTLVKDGNHRLSGPADLDRLERTVAALLDQVGA
jgi:pimeloyl-ACP methyl ester carboxylesterase